ncbi:MAG: hypothetical protein AB7F89_21285 [Pirellulaceae bacterium]
MGIDGLERDVRCIGFVKDARGTEWAVFEPGESRPIHGRRSAVSEGNDIGSEVTREK